MSAAPPGRVIVCGVCGHRNSEGTEFCGGCGTFLEWSGKPESAASAVTAALEASSLSVEPGQEASCTVRVRNTGSIVDEFRLQAVGPGAAWTVVEPAIFRLFPNSSDVARVVFRPPRSAELPAGPTPFGVKVSSTVRPDVYTVENGVVRVGTFEDWESRLVPEVARGQTTGQFQVEVLNRGNSELSTVISGTDPAAALSFEISPRNLSVRPGQSGRAYVSVTAPPGAPAGSEVKRPFEMVVEAADRRQARLSGSLVQVPPPPPPVQTVGNVRPPRPRRKRRRWPLLVLIGALLVLAIGTGLALLAANQNVSNPVAASITDEIGTSRCEVRETVDVTIDGQRKGTLRVDNQGRVRDQLQVQVSGAGSHDYSLQATADFASAGQRFTLSGNGQGTVQVAAGGGSRFSVEVDPAVLPANKCPAPNGRWPLLLRGA